MWILTSGYFRGTKVAQLTQRSFLLHQCFALSAHQASLLAVAKHQQTHHEGVPAIEISETEGDAVLVLNLIVGSNYIFPINLHSYIIIVIYFSISMSMFIYLHIISLYYLQIEVFKSFFIQIFNVKQNNFNLWRLGWATIPCGRSSERISVAQRSSNGVAMPGATTRLKSQFFQTKSVENSSKAYKNIYQPS